MFFFKDQYLNVFVWFAWDIVTFYTGIFNHIIHAYKQNEKENECEPLYIFCMKLHQFPGKCMQSGRRITTYTTYASGMMLVGVSLLQLQDCLVRCTSYAMHLLGECMMRILCFWRNEADGTLRGYTGGLLARHDVKHTVCNKWKKSQW